MPDRLEAYPTVCFYLPLAYNPRISFRKEINLAKCRHTPSEIIKHNEDQILFVGLGPTGTMKTLTSANYTKDQLYPGVARAVAEILKRSTFVAPVEVLLHTQRITKQQYEDWRFGRIPYLERVCVGNLGKMNRILRIIELHCRKQNLTPSQTVYRKWGKGGKRIVLRFSKSGDPKLEAAYARHYVAKNQPPPQDDCPAQLSEEPSPAVAAQGAISSPQTKGVEHGQDRQKANIHCVDQVARRA